MKKVFEKVEISESIEDAGHAVITTMSPASSDLFIRLNSWDNDCEHQELKEMNLDPRKCYRVTLLIEEM